MSSTTALLLSENSMLSFCCGRDFFAHAERIEERQNFINIENRRCDDVADNASRLGNKAQK
jgi:hypothetical protein